MFQKTEIWRIQNYISFQLTFAWDLVVTTEDSWSKCTYPLVHDIMYSCEWIFYHGCHICCLTLPCIGTVWRASCKSVLSPWSLSALTELSCHPYSYTINLAASIQHAGFTSFRLIPFLEAAEEKSNSELSSHTPHLLQDLQFNRQYFQSILLLLAMWNILRVLVTVVYVPCCWRGCCRYYACHWGFYVQPHGPCRTVKLDNSLRLWWATAAAAIVVEAQSLCSCITQLKQKQPPMVCSPAWSCCLGGFCLCCFAVIRHRFAHR